MESIKSTIILTLIIFLIIPCGKSEFFNFLWIPNSGSGNSVSKVNATNGYEVGRYWTLPPSIGTADNSRTAVDSNGNCWIGNRNTNTLVKIGMLENGQCVDRNGDGYINTSKDENGDGVIQSNEVLPFGEDECFLKEVFLESSAYITYTNRGGVRAVCVDENDNVYAGMYNLQKFYYIDKNGNVLRTWYIPDEIGGYDCHPYGCIVDKDGYVWISCVHDYTLLRYNPSTDKWDRLYFGYYVYGIAPCYAEDCFVFNGWDAEKLTKINSKTLETIFALDKSELRQGRGVIVDENENIYAVSTYYDKVYKYDKNGNKLAEALTCDGPTGVGIDPLGKVWVTCYYDNCIRRYDKNLNFEVERCFGTGHYTYSDFSGYIRYFITPPPIMVEYKPKCQIMDCGIYKDIGTLFLCNLLNWMGCNVVLAFLILLIVSIVINLFRRS